jgi:hypothetical protein
MGFFNRGNEKTNDVKEEEPEEEQEEEEPYDITIPCDNCEEDIDVSIPYGQRIKEYLSQNEVICEFCGCKLTGETK